MINSDIIGHIVRDERKAQGLRQDELAAASGVGVRFIVDLERGKPTVQMGKALTVLEALGCKVQIHAPTRNAPSDRFIKGDTLVGNDDGEGGQI